MSDDKLQFVGFKSPRGKVQRFDEAILGVYNHRTAALNAAMDEMIRKLEEEKRQREAQA